MSKSTTSTKKSRSTAASAETATGVQQDGVVTTSMASDPSGLRAPDGTHSTNTPASSGDAAGDASADLVKPQVNADHTGTIQATAANETPMPEVEASASGTIANASQGDADGAGANAGSASLKVEDINHLNETLALAAIGGKLLETIAEVAREYPELQEWIGSDDPASIVRELVEENAILKEVREYANKQDTDLQEHVGGYASMTREDFQRNFPLSYALLSSFTGTRSPENPPLVRVTSQRDGFRRGGVAHSTKPVDYRPGELSPEQLEAILAEPLLTVEVV
ncbi:HI1506-related protein [Agrobacterium pusense]|uniref:Mu-like prophage FluMu N-terminal domain-containing protein n=1 Tax=Agrobacterium pusense TaxID=648995 RepID=A0AA44EJ27_9HYPH|nr:HI1506-related protein [Agrobacterium pusense]NRF09371.1 hypothetical protein [Agrobacterium pusense]NRF19724.1 hypothetical protein [Agrobacterium pusense]